MGDSSGGGRRGFDQGGLSFGEDEFTFEEDSAAAAGDSTGSEPGSAADNQRADAGDFDGLDFGDADGDGSSSGTSTDDADQTGSIEITGDNSAVGF